MNLSYWTLIKVALILTIGILIGNGTIHDEEAFIVGSIGLFLIINLLTGWSPFCQGGCFRKTQ